MTDHQRDASGQLYGATLRKFSIDLFEKGTPDVAGVRMTHTKSGSSFGFSLKGVASNRTASGAVAQAQVGSLLAVWTTYADRVKEDIVASSRVLGDRIEFAVTAHGVSAVPDGKGGYLVRDARRVVLFHVLSPTARDAHGVTGKVTLELDDHTAVLSLDRAFAKSATYPIVIDPTVTLSGAELQPGSTLSAPAGSSITETWEDIDSPTSTDWIGIYTVDAPDQPRGSWQYVNCSQTATTAIATGSCPVTLPSTAGQYEFRLFANDGYTLLAVSNPLNVTAATSYSAAVLADSPTAYWRLDDNSGTVAADSSGQGQNASIVGGVTLGALGATTDGDTAMQFNGQTGYLAAPAGFSDFSSGLTIEAWVLPTAAGWYARVVDFGNGSGSDNILFARVADSNDLRFQVYNGNSSPTVTASNVLVTNAWQHIAVTLDGNGYATIYYNGQQVAAGQSILPRTIQRTDNYIGKSNWSDALFQGSLDEVAVYTHPLTANRMQAHFLAGAPPPPVPPASAYQAAVMHDAPLAYYRLDEASGNVVYDSSGSALHARLSNGGVSLGATGATNDGDKAAQLNGSNGYFVLPPGFSDFSSGLTIEAWILPTADGSWDRIVDLGVGASNDNIVFARSSTSNDLTFEVYQGGSVGPQVIAPNVLVDGVWQHLVVSVDPAGSGYATIYYNGQRIAAGQSGLPPVVQRLSNYIGKSNMNDALFQGTIDEVAIYNHPLSADRVQAHFAAGRTVTPPSPTAYQAALSQDSPSAYWWLDEASRPVATDRTGHGNNGAIVGGVTLSAAGATSDGDHAMQFDGNTGYLKVPPGFSNFSGGLTVEAWVNPAASGSYARITDFGNGSGSDNILLSRIGTSNDLGFEVFSGGSAPWVTASNVLVNNVWQHVAVTLDSSGYATIYYNGQPVAAGQSLVPQNVLRSSNYIGKSNWNDALFQGSLDEVAVYDHPLGPDRIWSDYWLTRSVATSMVGAHASYQITSSSGASLAFENTVASQDSQTVTIQSSDGSTYQLPFQSVIRPLPGHVSGSGNQISFSQTFTGQWMDASSYQIGVSGTSDGTWATSASMTVSGSNVVGGAETITLTSSSGFSGQIPAGNAIWLLPQLSTSTDGLFVPNNPPSYPPPGPFGYDWSWSVGTVAELGDASAIMAYFQQHPGNVFPFPVGECTTIVQGAVCDFRPIAGASSIATPLLVSQVACKTFTLTALPGHFDPPGSTVQFSTYGASNTDYLQQSARWALTTPWNLIASFLTTPAAFRTWGQQASNLRTSYMRDTPNLPAPAVC